MSYGDDSGYGGRKQAGYGDDSSYGDNTEGGGYGQKTGGYGDDTQGAGQGGYGQESSGYGDDGQRGLGSNQKDSDGDGIPDEFQNSQFNREDVENLKDRTDIDDGEKEHRRKKLMEEVAGGVVGAGVLGIAGYKTYEHFNKDDDEQKSVGDDGQQQPEKKSSWF